MIGQTLRAIGLGGMAMSLLVVSAPSIAQSSNDEVRLRKLEAEVRALQRKVFPGGDGRFFEPEITGQPTTPRTTVTTPSTTAVTDILARMDALESQVQMLTAQSEENANTMRALENRVRLLEGGGAAPANGGFTTPATVPSTGTRPATTTPAAATTTRPASPPAATRPTPERLAAVQAITKPQTGDAGDDEYSYGFRLWDAGFYPEAQQQLTLFVEKYPTHSRVSYGRNLLGRAYLDDGKAREAAPWFLKNYQTDKGGARAGDSLLYLADAMIVLKDTNRACIALAEFGETYPALASGRLQGQYEANRSKVKCK